MRGVQVPADVAPCGQVIVELTQTGRRGEVLEGNHGCRGVRVAPFRGGCGVARVVAKKEEHTKGKCIKWGSI